MRFWHKYTLMFPNISEFKTLREWWTASRNFYNTWPVSTQSTKNIDVAMEDFEILIDRTDQQLKKLRVERLHALHTNVTNWYRHHHYHPGGTIHPSKREPQLEMLKNWLSKEIVIASKDLKCDDVFASKNLESHSLRVKMTHWHNKVHPVINCSDATKHEIEKYGKQPKSDQELYEWWMRISKLSFYQMRSTQTKLLDEAIKRFSEEVILDRTSALRDLVNDIELWKLQRGATSERHSAVNLLEIYVSREIKKHDRENKANSFTNFYGAILSLPFFDFDYSIIFDSLAFLT